MRAAWRRIAAATHPDRDDGGDPLRFSLAAAAYATLRTSYGRGEALADMRAPAGAHSRPSAGAALGIIRYFLNFAPWRLSWHAIGRQTLGLTLRLLVAAAVCAGSFLAAGWSPATVGILAGALTWFGLACFRQAGGER